MHPILGGLPSCAAPSTAAASTRHPVALCRSGDNVRVYSHNVRVCSLVLGSRLRAAFHCLVLRAGVRIPLLATARESRVPTIKCRDMRQWRTGLARANILVEDVGFCARHGATAATANPPAMRSEVTCSRLIILRGSPREADDERTQDRYHVPCKSTPNTFCAVLTRC